MRPSATFSMISSTAPTPDGKRSTSSSAIAILRAGAYELIARADVPVGSVISEYVDVAHAFYDKRESGFVNGLLDAIAKEARPARAD